jgi:hypothetical protein
MDSVHLGSIEWTENYTREHFLSALEDGIMKSATGKQIVCRRINEVPKGTKEKKN